MQTGKVFLRLKEVIQRTGKSRSSIYAAVKIGKFPKPVRIGARSVAWDSSEIEAWQDSCIASSARQ